MPPKPKPLSEPLKPVLLAGLILLLPIALTAFVVGIFGMRILLDEDGTSSLSKSQFAQYYKRLIAMNPFFSALFFNGGMITSMFCVTKLVEHFRAVKRQAIKEPPPPAAASGSAATEATQEAKKDK